MDAFSSGVGGNHSWWSSPTKNRRSSVPRHTEVNDILARKICKDLAIPSFFTPFRQFHSRLCSKRTPRLGYSIWGVSRAACHTRKISINSISELIL